MLKTVTAFLSLAYLLCEVTSNDTRPHLHMDKLEPGELRPIAWENGNRLTKNLYAVGLPPRLRTQLLSFVEEKGILERFQTIKDEPLEEGHDAHEQMGESVWFIQRPPARWNSNMHWISPGEEKAQQEFLMSLEDGGFNDTLDAIGMELGLDGIVCYHLTFIAVTNCSEIFWHHDFLDTGASAYNLIIPLMLKDDSTPELDVWEDEKERTVRLKYVYDTGVMLGDKAWHATSPVDYTGSGEMRVMATIYLADVNEDNVDGILQDYTQSYPPKDRSMLLAQRGKHWRREPDRIPHDLDYPSEL